MSDVQTRALKWSTGPDTGVSSMAILRVMTGDAPKDGYCYPHDGGDLGRCLGLLKAVPEFRARLDEMRAVGPEWSALVDHWAELEAMHGAGKNDALYKRMREIRDPIEAKRPGLIRFPNGSAIYFGAGR